MVRVITPLSTFQIYYGSLFYWWRKLEDPEKTTDMPQFYDNFYHIMLYTSPWSRFELTILVVIGIDCTGSCKSNNHMITTTTTLHCFLVYLLVITDQYIKVIILEQALIPTAFNSNNSNITYIFGLKTITKIKNSE